MSRLINIQDPKTYWYQRFKDLVISMIQGYNTNDSRVININDSRVFELAILKILIFSNINDSLNYWYFESRELLITSGYNYYLSITRIS
jgi:hypothetical protein